MKKQLFIPQILYFNDFQNLETINNISQGWDNRWTYIKTGTTEAKLWVFTTPRIQFSWVGYDNAIMIDSSPPFGTIQLSFIRTTGLCNTNNKKTTPNEIIIIESGEDTNYLANKSNEIFTLVFEKSFFTSIFQDYFGEDYKKIRFNYKLQLKENMLEQFIQKIKNWFLFFQNQNLELSNEKYYFIENNIIENLFSMIITSEVKYKQEKQYIKKARIIIEENIDNIYKISDLVSEFDITARALQYNFKKELGITPKQYQQNLRLNAIKNDLLSNENNKKNIAEIISKYGFFHPSNFTLEYKNFFGRTPSQTLSK